MLLRELSTCRAGPAKAGEPKPSLGRSVRPAELRAERSGLREVALNARPAGAGAQAAVATSLDSLRGDKGNVSAEPRSGSTRRELQALARHEAAQPPLLEILEERQRLDAAWAAAEQSRSSEEHLGVLPAAAPSPLVRRVQRAPVTGSPRGQRLRVRRTPSGSGVGEAETDAQADDELLAQQKALRASTSNHLLGGPTTVLGARSATLLTKAEEALLVTRAQVGMALEHTAEQLAVQLGHAPSRDELALHTGLPLNVLQQRMALGHQAKQLMVEHNLRLVISIARRYVGRGVELGDLVQEGAVGLVRGVEKFDPTKGYKFSTYSHWWIRQAVTRAVNEQSRTVRLPVHVNEALARMRKASYVLQDALQERPSNWELGRMVGLSADKVRKLLASSRDINSMEADIALHSHKEGRGMVVGDSVAARALPLEDDYDSQFLTNDLHAVLNTLEPRERNVLCMHYGLTREGAKTLVDVGTTFGISRERVRQIEDIAFRKLRSPQRSQTLLHHAADTQAARQQ